MVAVCAVLALLLVSLAPVPAAAQTFEGAVTVKVHPDGGGPPVDREYLLRNGAMRHEAKSGETPGVVIADPSIKTMYFLMPERRTYVVWPLATSGASGSHPDIVRTGRKETIAGYECELWRVKDANDPSGELSVCVATGLGAWALGGPGEPEWAAFVREQRGFPLKMSKASGHLVMEVIKVEAKPLDAALFTVPADYTELNIFTGAPRQR